MSRGLHERDQVTLVFEPKSVTSTAPAWNGHGNTTGDASGIDISGYDEALIELNFGLVGAAAVDVDCFDSATDDADAAAIITNAAGTEADYVQKTSADQNKVHLLRLRAKDHKKYLFIKYKQSTTGATLVGINVILSKANSEPVEQTNAMDFVDTTP